jgi:hypothetical protein
MFTDVAIENVIGENIIQSCLITTVENLLRKLKTYHFTSEPKQQQNYNRTKSIKKVKYDSCIGNWLGN